MTATPRPAFAPWPWTRDLEGRERRVGVEIELGGLDVGAVAGIVVDVWGGHAEAVGHHQIRVRGTRVGDVKVELDSRFVKERRHRGVLEAVGLAGSPVEEAIDDLVVRAAATVVPCEVVTPPLTLSALEEVEELRERLHLRGGEGTAAEPWYAFGVHFNPALFSGEAADLHAVLQAFCLLEDWLRGEGHVTWSRRLSPFVDPFPEPYRELVLRPGPPPDRATLVKTYLLHNATRNRGLDMLPAFSVLEPELVAAHVSDELVRPRPTFHYRLADSRIDEPQWRIADEWARWVEVERLAWDAPRRASLVERGVRAEGPG